NLHRHLRRSMSPDVADAIVRAPDGYYKAAEGNRRAVTVLFTDIRGFTSRSEEQDAGELVTQLNIYLERMVDVIFRHGGTVDKFIGDAIMATWGALGETDSTNQVKQAADSAQEMLGELSELNKRWAKEGLPPFRIGIGIHHGEAIVGEVGSDQRTDFTVIGDAVNLASRIEGLTKAFGVDLMISGKVSEILDAGNSWIEVAKVRVKGREGGVSLSMPKSVDSADNKVMQSLVHEYTSGNWDIAREQLHKLDDQSHFAGVIRFYSDLLSQSENPAADWDGLITMQTK
ncbi:MAG: adenylate/guanylate cyclase domain-containing protein, partial [Akkermansiaceae bacterium]